MAEDSKEKDVKKDTLRITKDMGIIEIAQKYPQTAEVFFKYGMHCLGCIAASFETLEQGAAAHGIDVDKMVEDLNKVLDEDNKKSDQ